MSSGDDLLDGWQDWGLYRDNGKENGNYYNTIGYILGLYGDNGKENGNYYNTIGYILGLYGDNGKENGNYYNTIGYILGLYGDNGKENGNYYLGYILGLYTDNAKESGNYCSILGFNMGYHRGLYNFPVNSPMRAHLKTIRDLLLLRVENHRCHWRTVPSESAIKPARIWLQDTTNLSCNMSVYMFFLFKVYLGGSRN